jgi:signal transduction histidine kinase
MEIAPEAVDVEPDRKDGRFAWATDNALVRAIARVRAPLGAKLIVGFTVIAGLLAAGYVLGFAALGQSNSRGEQLSQLQREAAYEQLVKSDAKQLKSALDRLDHLTAAGPDVANAYGLTIADAAGALCFDGGFAGAVGGGIAFCGAGGTPPKTGLTVAAIAPNLARTLRQELPQFQNLPGYLGSSYPRSTIAGQDRDVTLLVSRLTALKQRTQARAAKLVAQNHKSYDSSRNLLIGVGAATFILVLGLGLLLASSVVVPLRRTRARLAGIAAGDFSSEVEVPNRDELGGLADDVNHMNAELKRLYRELELASEHKSQFLTNMSHELRTPLNAIIGFTEVLREQMFGELNERQLAYVNDVLEAGRHLLSLINDVLDLAKIEAGRMDLELSQVAIPDILRSAASMHAERAGREGVELSLGTEPEEITITADERRVRQVVFNLVSNAVKFTPTGGQVDISARLEDGNVAVAVADTGPGIAAGELEAIFEEFEQTAEGKQVEGTGLGLPLSRKLVELHGGRLWAESAPGQGSTFRFTLALEARQ